MALSDETLEQIVSILTSEEREQLFTQLGGHQDFTASSDIDWSQPISDIDQQLYRKYRFTREEIDYIEKTIKPVE